MPKYYYTDPLKAAWMSREFLVYFYQPPLGRISQMRDYIPYEGPFYVHQDSEHVIQYNTDDIIINDGEYMVVMDDGLATYVNLTEYYDHIPLLSISHDYEIILRNGKHFFMPEVKND